MYDRVRWSWNMGTVISSKIKMGSQRIEYLTTVGEIRLERENVRLWVRKILVESE